ncbi:efflux transporter outer membrane subunit [Sphingobacterium multivorum]|uniref:efflux transporter outer membrane subunit n=1 Tax=Sphingobacterium multivorum TaxID=28454 RepID=UPI0028A11965|nr:efflux transporter outer membrane subunit [Sphingobacterium multivorum]
MSYLTKNYRQIILITALLGTFVGCAITKDAKLPKPELPAAFRGETDKDTLGIAMLPWKSFFMDKVLQVMIDSTLKKNFDMQVALKNIESAHLLVRQSKWNNLPVVSLNATGNTSNPSNYSLNGMTASQFLGANHIEDYSLGASLTWEADVWGRIRNSNKAVLAAYLQSDEARKTLQTDLIISVSKGYYNLLMLDQQRRVAVANMALNDSTLRITNVQYKMGQATYLAVQQAEAQRLAVAELIPQLEKEIILQENALHVLAGELPGIRQGRTMLDEIKFPEQLSTGVPIDMVRRRPDVRSRELDLVIANAKVGISKAQLYPALRITAAGGVGALKASDWFNIPGALFGTVGGTILQPLLQHKELSTQYKIAAIEREKTIVAFRKTVLGAVGEVSDAIVKIEKLKQQQYVTAQRVNTLQQATANANTLFVNGMANYLEVITAQVNVLQSELDLASVRRQELSAIADLYRSLGGGVE